MRTIVGVATALLMLVVPVAAAAAQEAAGEPDSLLFVQDARHGSLRTAGGDPDAFVLTLRDVPGSMLWFTDRPERRSGHLTTQEALDLLDFSGEKGPPNAVLSIADANPGENMIALTLSDAEYDADTATARYEATRLPDVSATGLASYSSQLDDSVPRRFDQAALFIDSTDSRSGCTLVVKWGTTGSKQGPLTVTSVQDYIPDFSKYGSTSPVGSKIEWGGTWSTTSGTGLAPRSGVWCRGGTVFTGPDGARVFVFFNNKWTLTGESTWGCNAPAQYRCVIDGNPRSLFLTVNVKLDKVS